MNPTKGAERLKETKQDGKLEKDHAKTKCKSQKQVRK